MPEFGSPFTDWQQSETHGRGTYPRHPIHGRWGVRSDSAVHAARGIDGQQVGHRVLKDIADEERVHAGEFLRRSASWPQMKRNSMQKGRRRLKRKSKNQIRILHQ